MRIVNGLLAPIPIRYLRFILCPWSRWRDSNPRPAVYKTAALPAELHRLEGHLLSLRDASAAVQLMLVFRHTCRQPEDYSINSSVLQAP
jgi:hypothetical protein